MEASNQGKTRNCVSCGRAIAWDANVCQYCGHDFRAPAAAPPHEKTMLSLVGGIMVLVVGIMGLAMGGLFFAIDVSDLDAYGISGITGFEDTLQNILYVCGAIFVILGLIAVVGGFFGVRRKHWGLAILGGVLGLFILTPYFIGSLVSLVGLVLLAVSKKDFD
jgi:hypothetical protein